MKQTVLTVTLLLCLGAELVCLNSSNQGDTQLPPSSDTGESKIEILEPHPDGTDGLLYSVGIAEAGELDTFVTRGLSELGDLGVVRLIAIQRAMVEMAENRLTTLEVRLTSLSLIAQSDTTQWLRKSRIVKMIATKRDGCTGIIQIMLGMPIKDNVIEEASPEDIRDDTTKLKEILEEHLKEQSLNEATSQGVEPDLEEMNKGLHSENPIARYPNWFWQPPTATAIGYASITSDSDAVLKQAVNNGIENLAKATQVRVSGLIKYCLHAFGIDKTLSVTGGVIEAIFLEETDANVREYIQEKHQLLATYRGEQGIIVLLGLDKMSNLANHATDANTTAPDWFLNLPTQPGYLYAVGLSDANQLSNKAWIEAEKNARSQLALNFEARVSALRISIEPNRTSSWSRVSEILTDVTLSGVETVSRWYDTQEDLCVVLVRAPVSETKELR